MSQVVEKLLQTLEALSIWAEAAALLSRCQTCVRHFLGSLPSPLCCQALRGKEVSLEAYNKQDLSFSLEAQTSKNCHYKMKIP